MPAGLFFLACHDNRLLPPSQKAGTSVAVSKATVQIRIFDPCAKCANKRNVENLLGNDALCTFQAGFQGDRPKPLARESLSLKKACLSRKLVSQESLSLKRA